MKRFKSVWIVGLILVLALAGAAFAEEEAPNLALGAAVQVSSAYPSYEGGWIVDGKYPLTSEDGWNVSWASADEPKHQWAVITFKEEVDISSIEILWHKEEGTYMTPVQYKLEYYDGEAWVDIVEVTDGESEFSTLFDGLDLTTRRLRLFMPAKQGHPLRPNILWVHQVIVR